MTYLTVGAVSEFCPWDDGEVDELDIEGWIVPRGQRAADWAHVAAVSVAAVQTGAGEGDLDSWVAFGCREGLRREESDGFASLFYDPIDGGWLGRELAR